MSLIEDEIGKRIETDIAVYDSENHQARITLFVKDWRLVVRALQDAYRSHEFQRINGEKNAKIEALEREVRVLTDKLAHAEKRLNI